MKNFLLLFLVIALFPFLVGCPPPEAFVKASEFAFESSKNLDKNIDILGKNYFMFISKDTEVKVKAGKMTEEVRASVLKEVKGQMATLKEQSIINAKFILMAHDYCHDGKLELEDVLAVIKSVNNAYPDIKEFIENLGGK